MQKGNAVLKNLLYMFPHLVHGTASMQNYPLPTQFDCHCKDGKLSQSSRKKINQSTWKQVCGIKHSLLQLQSLEVITTARMLKGLVSRHLLE